MSGGNSGAVIGIDLGTTYSCVAAYIADRPEVIPIDCDKKTMPSCVAFTPQGRLFGLSAIHQMLLNPTNTITNVKRMIGREFHDQKLQHDSSYWPFQLVRDGDIPKILIQHPQWQEVYTAETISSMLLNHMLSQAREYLGLDIQGAVVSVPAYFNLAQRQATRAAAQAAGLQVLAILNEPVAAALAYQLDQDNQVNKQLLLVYDLGGGTCDVSVLEINAKGQMTVRSTVGETQLGGIDFTQKIVEYSMTKIEQMLGRSVRNDKLVMRELLIETEKAKCQLSEARATQIHVHSLNIMFTLERQTFESLIRGLVNATLYPVQCALKDAQITEDAIDQVILVGGSTRVPLVQTTLKTYFSKKQLCKSMNPDETVAYGAAIYAAVLSGRWDNPKPMTYTDALPLTIGIELFSGEMYSLFKRNQQVPCSFDLQIDMLTEQEQQQQTVIPFFLYQGERPRVTDNYFIGEFQCAINDIQDGRLNLKFVIDASNTLCAYKLHTATNQLEKLPIIGQVDALCRQDIDNMIATAERHRIQDDEERARQEALNNLEELGLTTLKTLQQRVEMSSGSFKESIERCRCLLNWLQENANATRMELEAEERVFRQWLQTILVCL
ncbi:heat shock 70kDa protein 1/2/6/8 [Paragonimus westermani]|uniref:Heat shock 70kDa protein 1/2/6/8 n=1 Tax=Paragonimus westermani TaxID=34504 RepID=A0A5J4NW65_9TREM|nr:heat shock 70kDa protein 1/2/6/8 [Paragonimus westermani]